MTRTNTQTAAQTRIEVYSRNEWSMSEHFVLVFSQDFREIDRVLETWLFIFSEVVSASDFSVSRFVHKLLFWELLLLASWKFSLRVNVQDKEFKAFHSHHSLTSSHPIITDTPIPTGYIFVVGITRYLGSFPSKQARSDHLHRGEAMSWREIIVIARCSKATLGLDFFQKSEGKSLRFSNNICRISCGGDFIPHHLLHCHYCHHCSSIVTTVATSTVKGGVRLLNVRGMRIKKRSCGPS